MNNIDYRIQPHLIEVADYDNIETPVISNKRRKICQIRITIEWFYLMIFWD